MIKDIGARKQRLIGAALSYIFTALNIIVNLIYAPILLRFLGKSEYGLYQMVASFIGYISIFEASISTGVLRYYCNAMAKKNLQEMENILFTSRRIYRFMAAFVLVLGIVLIYIFNIFYKSSLSEEELHESTLMLGALTLNLIVSLLNAVYIATINGNEKFIFAKSLQILIQLFQPLICCLAVMRYPYALTIVVGQLAVNTIAASIRFVYAKKAVGVRIVKCKSDRALFKAILIFASSLLFASIADQIFWKADQIIIGKIYSTSLVAVYAIGGQLYNCYLHIGTSFNGVFFPKISQLYQEENGMEKINQIFVEAGRISFFVLLLTLSGFIIFGKEFITLWVGSDYMEAYYVAIYVMIPFTIDLSQNLGLATLQVMNKYSFRAKLYFFAALLNIISTIYLTKLLGIRGAALSTGISMLITNGFVMNWYYHSLGFNIREFWRNIGGILLKTVPYSLAIYFLNSRLSDLTPGFSGLAVKIVLYSVGYFAIIYLLAINAQEKRYLKHIIGKLTKFNHAN